MKERILSILLSFICLFSMAVFSGCSSEESEEPTEQTETTEVQEEEEKPKLTEFTDEELAGIDLTNTYITIYGDVLQVTFDSESMSAVGEGVSEDRLKEIAAILKSFRAN